MLLLSAPHRLLQWSGSAYFLSFSVALSAGQDAVHVATSMALTAEADAATSTKGGSAGLVPVNGVAVVAWTEWAEGLALPPAVAGSGDLELTAGVGRLPAVVVSYTSYTAYPIALNLTSITEHLARLVRLAPFSLRCGPACCNDPTCRIFGVRGFWLPRREA